MDLSGLRNWLILRHLTDEELEDIEFVVVYGSERYNNEDRSALFITKGNYEVFGTGWNNLVEFSEHIIPFSSEEQTTYTGTHVKVDALCGLGIRKIVVGDRFGAALCVNNEVYVWGQLDMTVKNSGLIVMFEKYKPGITCAKCKKEEYSPAVFNGSSRVSDGHFSWCGRCLWYPSYTTYSEPPPETEVLKFIRGDKVLFPCLRCGRKCSKFSLSFYVINFCENCNLIREVSSADSPSLKSLAPRKVNLPRGIQVTDIESGRSFLVLKTITGRLLIWGAIDKDHYKGYVENPDNIIVKSISCGASHVAVISTCGKLYTFGYGKQGQLGYEWQESMGHVTMRKVPIPGRLTKFCCRRNGTVCLTDDRSVFIFGNYAKAFNHRHSATLMQVAPGQCVTRPLKVKGKFSDIACAHLSNIFVTQSDPLVVSWGHLKGNRTRGSIVSSSDFPSALRDLPMSFNRDPSPKGQQFQISSPSADLFGKSLISDMTLKLSDGLIPVHKFVLYTNSTYFKRFFEENDRTPNVLDVTFFNPKSYRALLKYFYKVPLADKDISCADLFDLYSLAAGYNENYVMADVLHRLKRKITHQNADFCLERAKNAGLETIVQECEKITEYPIIRGYEEMEETYQEE